MTPVRLKPGPSGGGGYSDIFIHTNARVIFGGSKFLNFNICGSFQKNNIFWGMKILWIFFCGWGGG